MGLQVQEDLEGLEFPEKEKVQEDRGRLEGRDNSLYTEGNNLSFLPETKLKFTTNAIPVTGI